MIHPSYVEMIEKINKGQDQEELPGHKPLFHRPCDLQARASAD